MICARMLHGCPLQEPGPLIIQRRVVELGCDQTMPVTGGALTFSCGLHLGSSSDGSSPTCLVFPGATLQEGQLQWPTQPIRFFVSGSAMKSLKAGRD